MTCSYDLSCLDLKRVQSLAFCFLVLTLTMLWTNFSRRENDIFLFFFLENTIWHLSKLSPYIEWQILLLRKIRELFRDVVCWSFYPACKILKELKNLTWMLKATRSIAVLVSVSLNKFPRTASTINLKNINKPKRQEMYLQNVRPAKIQISLRLRAVWSEPSLGTLCGLFRMQLETILQTGCVIR